MKSPIIPVHLNQRDDMKMMQWLTINYYLKEVKLSTLLQCRSHFPLITIFLLDKKKVKIEYQAKL